MNELNHFVSPCSVRRMNHNTGRAEVNMAHVTVVFYGIGTQLKEDGVLTLDRSHGCRALNYDSYQIIKRQSTKTVLLYWFNKQL